MAKNLNDIIDSKLPLLVLQEIDNPDEVVTNGEYFITKEELHYLINEEIDVPDNYPKPIYVLLREYKKAPKTNQVLRGKILCLLQKLAS